MTGARVVFVDFHGRRVLDVLDAEELEALQAVAQDPEFVPDGGTSTTDPSQAPDAFQGAASATISTGGPAPLPAEGLEAGEELLGRPTEFGVPIKLHYETQFDSLEGPLDAGNPPPRRTAAASARRRRWARGTVLALEAGLAAAVDEVFGGGGFALGAVLLVITLTGWALDDRARVWREEEAARAAGRRRSC